jgi:hypothetical protein
VKILEHLCRSKELSVAQEETQDREERFSASRSYISSTPKPNRTLHPQVTKPPTYQNVLEQKHLHPTHHDLHAGHNGPLRPGHHNPLRLRPRIRLQRPRRSRHAPRPAHHPRIPSFLPLADNAAGRLPHAMVWCRGDSPHRPANVVPAQYAESSGEPDDDVLDAGCGGGGFGADVLVAVGEGGGGERVYATGVGGGYGAVGGVGGVEVVCAAETAGVDWEV